MSEPELEPLTIALPPTSLVVETVERQPVVRRKRKVSSEAVIKALSSENIGIKGLDGKVTDPGGLVRGIEALSLLGQWSKDHDERNLGRGALAEEYADLINERNECDKDIAKSKDEMAIIEFRKIRNTITYQILKMAKQMCESEPPSSGDRGEAEQPRASFPANQPCTAVQVEGNANIVVTQHKSP